MVRVENALARYYDRAREAARLLAAHAAPGPSRLRAGLRTPTVERRPAPLPGRIRRTGPRTRCLSGATLTLLNMMGNPGTRTTKTFASLLMVARAVHRRTRSSPLTGRSGLP
ncbi:DUF6002 family protein [Streptomyces bicolor]|uniref:DUF6002 family protein n=1 Tax=Streptomyces bicolor TaxID=66874 RepID=UPI0034DD3B19